MAVRISIAAVVLVSALTAANVAAQETKTAAPAPPTPVVTCVENLKPQDGWKVLSAGDRIGKPETDLRKRQDNCNPIKMRWVIRMEDPIAIHVKGFQAWFDHGLNKQKALHLYVAGIELKNVSLRYKGPNPTGTGEVLWTALKFESEASDTAKESRENWAYMLRIARVNKILPVSIGEPGGPHWATTAAVEINPYPQGLFWFAVIVITFLLLSLILAGAMSTLLRDDNGAKKRPYSLARHQMAAWFLVVVSAYLFVTATTGAAAITSATAMTLIGISGATGLIAIGLDKKKRSDAEETRRNLAAEQAALKATLDDPNTGLVVQLSKPGLSLADAQQLTATIETKRQRLEVVNALLKIQPEPPMESRGWIPDLLSDGAGVSFHRFQIAVWTIVLMGTFVIAVWRTFAMPDFDATTLGLMGISSGMYVGFKFPEKVS